MTTTDASTTAQAAVAAAPGATVAAEKASSKKGTSPKQGATKGQKDAKPKAAAAAKTKKAPAKKASDQPILPREGSKLAQVIALISKKGGATLESLAKETGWANHTIRGFMSTLTRRTGVEFTSTRRESDKERVYEAVR
jgi:Protein of unknown function (DUF3489)